MASAAAAALGLMSVGCSDGDGSPAAPTTGAGGGQQGGGDQGGGGSGGEAGGGVCDGTEAIGIAVDNIDLEGYPPYAVDGCTLLYVAPGGALMERDLSSAVEQQLAASDASPRRPALAGMLRAWEAKDNGVPVVRVALPNDGGIKTMSGTFHHAGEPRVTAGAVVFTGWLSDDNDGDTDVFLFDVAKQEVSMVAGGAGQQRFADVSATHIAATDFSEDPDGVYKSDGSSLADLVVIERSSGDVAKHSAEGKQAYPETGDGPLGFLSWKFVHPLPKLEMYTLKVIALDALDGEGTTIAEVSSEPPYVRPTLVDGVFEWVVRDGGTTLWRAPTDLSAPPTKVEGLDGLELFAPVATSAFTILATTKSGPVELTVVAR